MVERAGSLRPTETIEKGSNIAPSPDLPLSALATIGATITEDDPTAFRTTLC